ncbi:FCD domain-containing protein [Spongiactinospora sp. TRM90649]|uniref:FadR/GntR family transcriptional regulator n=1 Tax=Spongiactinospora sp. TRM90649 TaxID=3031114 RepID=UPI0023F72854|nr:FCD domain-containing protein [Spongiactinospora sp. TRM90649]MDF5756924.1 FCD domain-containing protein [Spongiactinospora sp. TRM90649]
MSEEVIEQIREAFFGGLQPGDWLGTETELAERFGVSRITIRDAVRTLEARGIVDVKVGARGGLRIAEADQDRFIDALAVQLHLLGVTFTEVIEAQCAIEPLTASMAARQATDEQLRRVAATITAANEVIGDPAAFTERSLDFHIAVAEASGNRALHATLIAFTTVQKPKMAPRANERRARRVVKIHEEIYQAIADGDEERARTLMDDHVRSVRREHPETPLL